MITFLERVLAIMLTHQRQKGFDIMSDYRTATATDHDYILDLIRKADAPAVLVRSLGHPERPPYPLQKISKGPFTLAFGGIFGFSKDGEPYCIRITDTPLHSIELRRDMGPWYPPEQGGVILLVPK